MLCAGDFLQCALNALYRGATGHFLQGFFNIEKSWYMPVFFCWLLVGILTS